jgi:mannosylglycerate hydrolase
MSKTCFIVSHTHWDREWYEPFQRFRLRLVRLMDKLLHILDNDPQYRYFTLDGQTIVLEDYLQIRPERENDLRRHIQGGRLLIGPWHVLPDEFLVSGEALVRNLLLGDQVARRFGPKMMVGYTPDPFGHISQLPQLLRGFGIDCAVLARGLGDEPVELLWQAPDGSTVLLFHLRDSYDNAARLPVHDAQALASEITRLYHSLSPYSVTDYVLLMNGVDHMEPVPELPRALAAARELLPDIELVHGTLPMYIDAVKKSLQFDPTSWKCGSDKLPVVQGELRSSKRHHLLSGVLSARMWIKQRNHHIQNLLEKWAEPFATFAAALACKGKTFADPSRSIIWQAWKYLLENQPHDSICGCSIDQTHREMVTRFDWAEQIAEEITQQSLTAIANQVDTLAPESRLPHPHIPLIVFNPLAAARTDLVQATVQVPGSLENFLVVDERGQPTPHQVLTRKDAEFAALQLGRDEVLGLAAMVEMVATLGLSVEEIHISSQGDTAKIDVTLMEHGHTDAALIAHAQSEIEAILAEGRVETFFVRAHQATRIGFQFVAQDVPGCGYKTYFLVPNPSTTSTWVTTETATTKLHMENEFLAVDVNPEDGTFTLLDKSTGMLYPGLHRFVDGGDRGDEYNYCPPERDQWIATPCAPPEITWLEHGPARWTIQVHQRYLLPAALTEDRSGRSEERVEVPITSQISLCAGVPRLDFSTRVRNCARDHRLRVHFPTPIYTDCSEAESTFDVVKRPLGVPANTTDWIEQPVPTHPQKTFVDVHNGKIGLMVVNRGLPEYEALQEEDGKVTIALTLLRCVGWLSRDDYPCRKGHAGPALETPEAQCMGDYVFEYALVPHAGTWLNAFEQAHAFNAPLRAVSTDGHAGTLPLEQSLLTLEGKGLVLSAVKTAETGDGFIVRFYNITDEPTTARLRTSLPAKAAMRVNLAEEELEPLHIDHSGILAIPVRGKQIITVKWTGFENG